MSGVACIADVVALEREHDGLLPNSTYKMIGTAARAHHDAPALSFFARVEDHGRPEVWNYETLFARITATANFLHELGVGADDVVAFVLPNLPQTHLAIWGAQAAGIAFSINPMLEPAAIADLLNGLCGAAPMPVELMRAFQQSTGLKILEGYGLTDGTCVSTCNPPLGERRSGSIGQRLPLQAMTRRSASTCRTACARRPMSCAAGSTKARWSTCAAASKAWRPAWTRRSENCWADRA